MSLAILIAPDPETAHAVVRKARLLQKSCGEHRGTYSCGDEACYERVLASIPELAPNVHRIVVTDDHETGYKTVKALFDADRVPVQELRFERLGAAS